MPTAKMPWMRFFGVKRISLSSCMEVRITGYTP